MSSTQYFAKPRALALLGALVLLSACSAGNGGIDSGPGDTGAPADGGSPDAGSPDAGSPDAGGPRPDTGPPDSGPRGFQCETCVDDSQCGAGAYCVMLPGGGRVCLNTCIPDLPSCPARFDCVDSLTTGREEPVCTPVGERCCVDGDFDDHGVGVGCRGPDCDDTVASVNGSALEACNGVDDDCDGAIDEGDPGSEMVCSTGLAGACGPGTTICQDGAIVCQPNVEVGTEACDGVDNDCDARVDEDDSGTGAALTRACYDGPSGTGDVGACSSGAQTCAGGDWGSCNGQVLPAAEACDNVDNDCNGTVDDGIAGGGFSCSAAGSGVCSMGTTRCSDGAIRCVSDITPGSRPETCDYVDNDCDGTTDEGYLLGRVCSGGEGECRRSGVTECNASGDGTQCTATPGSPTSERCDSLDNDCDSTVDEGFFYSGDPMNPGTNYPIGSACAAGQGVCRRGGVVVCSGSGSGAECNAPTVTGSAESCDYLDNDCDGRVDEGFVDGMGRYTGDTNCGACGVDCGDIYSFPNSFGTCSVASGSARCVQNCDPGSYNLNGVPDDGCEFVLDPGAVYVSGEDPMARDDAGCGLGPVGTGAGRYPCRSIGQGITRATSLGLARVLVADAQYVGDVTVVNGVSLLGGYRADTWERHLSTTLTGIRGTGGSGHRRAVIASNITQPTVLEGFIIEGASASSPGANSYAIYASGSTSALTIRNNAIYAGNGAPGSADMAGTDGAAGVNGSPGVMGRNTGTAACSITVTGSPGGARSCGGTSVSGGAGGNTTCPPRRRSTPASGRAGGPGQGVGAGAGGGPGYDGEWQICNNTCLVPAPNSPNAMRGANGARGADGSRGDGASSAVGAVSAGDWMGASGLNGGNATHGAGGGGGGGGGGADGPSGCHDDLGGTGGGGGSGACGGGRGVGGGGGGGSFAIFLVNPAASRPTLIDNTIYRGFGGNGGNGGRGGTGGVGGAGGDGGPELPFCTGVGGAGGDGGNGGHGGGGGGGAGGAAYGVYAQGTANYGASTNTFPVSGGGGNGGSGGSSLGTNGGSGINGAHRDTN